MYLPTLLLVTFGLPVLALVLSCVGTRLLLGWLHKRAILDVPNDRSNHVHPTPRGGGIAVIATILLLWAVIPLYGTLIGKPLAFDGMGGIMAGIALLAAISWWDDVKGLGALPRLLAQAVAVLLGLQAVGPVIPEWPFWMDRTLLVLGWLWFINLFNFMDGIDGISATETMFIAAGIWLITLVSRPDDAWLLYSGVVGAAALGFAVWNRPPARIFLGDVGSVPLGYILAFLLTILLQQGYYVVALLIPFYYLADATSTLAMRAFAGQRVWQAHSQHAYQYAVRGGLSHRRVVAFIAALNMILLVLAVAVQYKRIDVWLAVTVAILLTFLLIGYFRSRNGST